MSQVSTSSTIAHRTADNIRILSAAMVEQAQSGHPGGAMGGADYMSILFTEFMAFDPSDPRWPFRDRFFLDPGHMSAMLYATLHLFGHFSTDDLKHFRQWGSPTPGHPELDVDRAIENTSGPLGQGHTFGIGAAIAERFLAHRFGEWSSHRTYIFISDGGIQEEISQGAGRTAGYLGLGHVVMFYDANDIQLSARVEDATNEDTAQKYEAWGWQVQTIDGNDHEQIRAALQAAHAETERPSLIIGKTVMGKGVKLADGTPFEGEVSLHGQALSGAGASLARTIEGLGGDPERPFEVFPEVAEFFDQLKAKLTQVATVKKEEQAAWATANPELANKLHFFLSGELPAIDYANISQKEKDATRNASGNVLAVYADQIENMIVSSADLSNSDKTNAFLKKTTSFKKGDFSGQFLQAGVSELTMASLSVGMSLHGGVIPVCATFFAFSDYMKPTLRLAALMEQPVKFIYTHDAFRVGEDGPTHQPVEQEAQIRLLEQLQTHRGHNGFLVLRPADGYETTVAWQMAMANRQSPTALILSRQGIQQLPTENGQSRYEAALATEKGAYIVELGAEIPDLILLANGSEVATMVSGAQLLRERKGLKVRIVSAPSEGRFREQDASYQASVLPPKVPIMGLTAGLPVTLRGLVGPFGTSIGLTHFGHSAPYTVLDEKLGYTAENVYQHAVAYLKEYPALRERA